MNLNEVWQRIEAHLKRERQDLLEQLTGRISVDDTNIVRGRVYQIDDLLKSIPDAIRASN